MLTYDTVVRLDRIADAQPTHKEHFALTRLATVVSTVVSAREAMQRGIETTADAEFNTYTAGRGDGYQLAADLIKVVEDALAAYIDTQVIL